MTPIQIIPNQWDYPPLHRNQTHSLSRRLELPAFALTFVWVPAFLIQTQEREEDYRAPTWENEIFFYFLRVSRWLIYEEDTLGCGHKQASPLREAHEKTQRCPSSPTPRRTPPHLGRDTSGISLKKDNILFFTLETKNVAFK